MITLDNDYIMPSASIIIIVLIDSAHYDHHINFLEMDLHDLQDLDPKGPPGGVIKKKITR